MTAPRDRTLSEVHDRVVIAWKDATRAQKLDDTAVAAKQRLENKDDIQAVAADLGVTVKTATKLTRATKPSDDLSTAAIAAAFGGPQGSAAMAEGVQPMTRVVLRIDSVTIPALRPRGGDTCIEQAAARQPVRQRVPDALRRPGPEPDQGDLQPGRPAVSPGRSRRHPVAARGGGRPMLIEPALPEFATRYDEGEAQVVWTRLVADLETPVSAMLKLSAGRSDCFLLESVEGGAVRGRYSIIGIEPDMIFRAFGDRAEINTDPKTSRETYEPMAEPSLAAIRRVIGESRITLPAALPPMAAGVFGYLGYDMVRQMEDLGPPNPDPLGLPDAILFRRQPSLSSTRSRTRSPSSRRPVRQKASAPIRPTPVPSTG